MFSKTTPVIEPAPDVTVPAEPPVALSHLELDLPAPVEGWAAHLAARNIEITLDDIGRMSVNRGDARQLFDEQRQAEVRRREKAAELERQAVEQDQQRRASIWGGIPADLIPVGVAPAQAMVAAEKDARRGSLRWSTRCRMRAALCSIPSGLVRVRSEVVAAVPAPLACDGQVTFDPATRSLSVKVSGVGASFWRKGHAALLAAEEAGRHYAAMRSSASAARSVWAHAPGRRDIARGEPVRDGWLRFQLSDADYRKLVNTPDLSVIVTVDREAGRILGVKFLGRRPLT